MDPYDLVNKIDNLSFNANPCDMKNNAPEKWSNLCDTDLLCPKTAVNEEIISPGLMKIVTYQIPGLNRSLLFPSISSLL